MAEQSQRCPSCGEFFDEWEGPDGTERRDKPKAPTTFMCFSCRDVAQYSEAQQAKHEGGKLPGGVRVVLAPKAASPKRR